MITIWCQNLSTGARDLVNKINELGHKAQRITGGTKPANAIHWGRGGGNKFQELQTLAMAGITVPRHTLTRQSTGWLARNFHHTGANDLQRGTGRDFWVQKLDVDQEYRFHIFDGRSIHRQIKIPRKPAYHPWIRSWASGWKLVPGGDATDAMRTDSKRAVAALGYDFGAVDIGRLRSGGFVIFEVNTAPGIEGSTITAYAKAIIARTKGNHA